jgi:hypothetical protein
MEKLNELKLDRLFALSREEAKKIPESIREYSSAWWLRTPYSGNGTRAYIFDSAGGLNTFNVTDTPMLSRTSFLLNCKIYSGMELEIGDVIILPSKDGEKAKFIYALDVDGEKLMLAADDILSEKTRYGAIGCAYEASDLRKVIQRKEELLTPGALDLMLPVEVRGNDVNLQFPVQENVRSALNKLDKKENRIKKKISSIFSKISK